VGSSPRRWLRSSARAAAASRLTGTSASSERTAFALPHLHLGNLTHEASVPAERRPLALSGITVSEEQRELECLGKANDLQLGGC
jgi:hypothetical protein